MVRMLLVVMPFVTSSDALVTSSFLLLAVFSVIAYSSQLTLMTRPVCL